MCGGGVQGGDDARVVTGSGAQARAPLPAINSPFNDWVVMHNKQSAYCTCVATARVPRGTVARALFWDTADPYYYVRRQEVPGAGYDLLVVGGEDHKTGEATDPEAHLRCPKEWTRAHFPGAKEFEYRWSGQVLEPNDGLAFAGRNPLDADNVFVITGDSGHGMTYGTLGARLVADLVQGRANPWARLYDPGRVTVARESALEFVRENASVVVEYTELLTGGDVASVDEIPAG